MFFYTIVERYFVGLLSFVMHRSCDREVMTLQYFCAENKVNDWTNHWKRRRLVWWRKFANVRSNFSLNEEQADLEPGVSHQTIIQVRYASQSYSNTYYLFLLANDLLQSYCRIF